MYVRLLVEDDLKEDSGIQRSLDEANQETHVEITTVQNEVQLLHVEIVLKTKQQEAETSLVYDVFIRVIKKRARAERVTREKETE